MFGQCCTMSNMSPICNTQAGFRPLTVSTRKFAFVHRFLQIRPFREDKSP
jgi:hypothetical protein